MKLQYQAGIPGLHFEVSDRIHEELESGRDYALYAPTASRHRHASTRRLARSLGKTSNDFGPEVIAFPTE